MLYLIGDFSKISKLSIRTLRYYHEIGILSPSFIDNNNGYRYYDDNCIEKARIINELKKLEFSLGDIKEILNDCTVIKSLLKTLFINGLGFLRYNKG